MPPARWTQEAIIRALRRDARQRGRVPKQRDWSRSTRDRPTNAVVVKLFGSWRDGLRAAGLDARPPANVRPDRCAKGHELTPDNVFERKSGGRLCLTCKRERDRATMKRWRRRSQPGYCRRGHPLVDGNIVTTSKGDRQCAICKRRADLRSTRRARRAARAAR